MQPEEAIRFSGRQLRAMILPLMLEQIFGVAVGMADTVMVSWVGEEAVSGVSLVENINILLINLFMALSTGGAVVAAQALGRNHMKQVRKAADQLLLSIVTLSVIVMTLSLIGNKWILNTVFGNVDDGVMSNAVVYFYITALSYPFLALHGGCSALCRSAENTKITMYVSMLMNVINITGNAVCLLVLRWGTAGVAVSTLISRIVGALLLLRVVRNQKSRIHISRPFCWNYDLGLIKRIMGIGVPTGIDNAIFQVGKLLVHRLVAGFGTAAIAANAICGMVAGCSYIPGNAVGTTFLTVIGQTVGAGESKQAGMYVKKLMKTAFVFMAVLNLVIFLGAPAMVGWYHLSPAGEEMAVEVIRYHSVAAVFLWPLAFALPNALRAGGDARFTMLVSIFSMWVWRIGASYLLSGLFGMGLLGVWIAMSVDWMFRAGCFILRIRRAGWIKK